MLSRASIPDSIFEKSRRSSSTLSKEWAEALAVSQVLTRLRRELGAQGKLRHTDDAVHGRADLVAHVGQELGLEARGLEGGLPGPESSLAPPASAR